MKQETVRYIDDVEDAAGRGPVEAERTLVVANEYGIAYEVDLSPGNIERYAAVVAEFVNAGRRVGRVRPNAAKAAAGASGGSETREDRDKIRAFAVANNYKIGERGRIPRAVREAYLRETA